MDAGVSNNVIESDLSSLTDRRCTRKTVTPVIIIFIVLSVLILSLVGFFYSRLAVYRIYFHDIDYHEVLLPQYQSSNSTYASYYQGIVGSDKTLKSKFVWDTDVLSFKSGLDLPRVFDSNVANLSKYKVTKTRVCVYTRIKRQDSLFSTNRMAMFGTHKYYYDVLRATDCQFAGTCRTERMARWHSQCIRDAAPTVYLVEWRNNSTPQYKHQYLKVLSHGLEFYDIVISTGDEWCMTTAAIGHANYRTYSGDGMVNSLDNPTAPNYLPLGPREEFKRVSPESITLADERQYIYNFAGSFTSDIRKALKVIVEKDSISRQKKQVFLHFTEKWKAKLTANNGYIDPHTYRQVLLNSTFTLCPQGHNPESFRIFEACEAGSIPILVLNSDYYNHECKNSLRPFIDSGAPFIFLSDWSELPLFIDQIEKDSTSTIRLRTLQASVMSWYSKFMKTVAKDFENKLINRWKLRQDNIFARAHYIKRKHQQSWRGL